MDIAVLAYIIVVALNQTLITKAYEVLDGEIISTPQHIYIAVVSVFWLAVAPIVLLWVIIYLITGKGAYS